MEQPQKQRHLSNPDGALHEHVMISMAFRDSFLEWSACIKHFTANVNRLVNRKQKVTGYVTILDIMKYL